MQSESLKKNSSSCFWGFRKSAQIGKIKEIKSANGLSKKISSWNPNKENQQDFHGEAYFNIIIKSLC